jgi:hypothetical protein
MTSEARPTAEQERAAVVRWLRDEYDQLMTDAQYLHSHGSDACHPLFEKASHNRRIADAIEAGQHIKETSRG